jgi:hypothetical protein
MKPMIVISVLFLFGAAVPARADSYVLSPDGSAVVRLTPVSSVSANSISTTLLPAGYTATTGSLGSLSVTTYSAGFMNGVGGAKFTALYDKGVKASSNLNWVQVVTTNNPLGSVTSPYLDNAANLSQPF